MPLVVVQNDREYERVKRNCRFSVPREVAVSAAEIKDKGLEAFPHLMWHVAEWQDKAIERLEKLGYKYTGEPFDLVGPMDHMEFATTADADPGLFTLPADATAMSIGDGARILEQVEKWQRAQRATAAKKLGEEVDVVDYELVGEFFIAEPTSYRSSNFGLGKTVLDPRNMPSPERLRRLARKYPQLRRRK